MYTLAIMEYIHVYISYNDQEPSDLALSYFAALIN